MGLEFWYSFSENWHTYRFSCVEPKKIWWQSEKFLEARLIQDGAGGHIEIGRVCNLITKSSRTMFKLCKITYFRMGNSFMTLFFIFELTLTLKSKMAHGGHIGIVFFCNLKTTRSRAMFKLCKITNFRMGNWLRILVLCFE